MTAAGPMAAVAARVARRAAEVAICLDFDGTISPIVEDPATIRGHFSSNAARLSIV